MKVSTVRGLSSDYRRQLESAVVDGRRAAEAASLAALQALGVTDDRVPGHLSEDQRVLRRGLRAKLRQLGAGFDLLVAECAYEQWHRLLFARFLAENELLLHPQYRAPVTIAECEDLAPDLGEPDGWSVAARFAAEVLPGIFRLDDPCVQLRLAPEGRLALERIVADLPAQVFKADDSLGWVYQSWQKEKKDEVNASGRKIGGVDLGPVTQLFTENYMVRFLLENSLGAWWAARYPNSPLVKDFDYLRLDDDGQPATGSFDGWPDRTAQVTVMDPCCGSGHFLVEAFSMLWQMRAEEEGINPVEAQDAVLRDNLFGLELDPRCVEIAMMSVVLQAWKAGGGWRELPMPNIACSGVPVKAQADEWAALADCDERLENALVRLHVLFREADTLGSLIDPKRATEIADPSGLQQSFEDVEWDEIAPLLEEATKRESSDPATSVLGADAIGVARAADYLSRAYNLVTTNPPFLALSRAFDSVDSFAERRFPDGKTNLATVFLARSLQFLAPGGQLAFVMPEDWLFLFEYQELRGRLLRTARIGLLARLGARAFSTNAIGSRVRVVLTLIEASAPTETHQLLGLETEERVGDFTDRVSLSEKARRLREVPLQAYEQAGQLENPNCVLLVRPSDFDPLSAFCEVSKGLSTGDAAVFVRQFWEQSIDSHDWQYLQSAPTDRDPGGRSKAILWEEESGRLARWADSVSHLNHAAQAWRLGKPLWERHGVGIALMGGLSASEYEGDRFDSSMVAVVPMARSDLPAIRSFLFSEEFASEVRRYNTKLSVEVHTIRDLPVDIGHWRRVAQERYPGGLPEPWSDDPTQWLFQGRPEASTDPLQVAVGRMLGYEWPEQPEGDDLDELADEDGIVCLPSVAGEPPAADRLQRMLTSAFGSSWSPSRLKELLEGTGSKKKNLGDWLRDDFFKQHCRLFQNRPFIWQVWDGGKDGFSALVNYHRLDRKALEKLTYTYLGQDWVERQKAGRRDDVPGAEARLAAALDLQRKLEAILEGEPPYDIYVRWKRLEEQPIGWDPDLNDGVRLNARPFVEAGILRARFNVHWRKDRGKNPDGSERHNDLHFSRAEKLDAREKAGRA